MAKYKIPRFKELVEPFAIIMIVLGLIWYFLSGIPTEYSQEENRPSCYEEEYSMVIENECRMTPYK